MLIQNYLQQLIQSNVDAAIEEYKRYIQRTGKTYAHDENKRPTLRHFVELYFGDEEDYGIYIVPDRYRCTNKNIAEVLDMRVTEALKFFENVPKIKRKLEVLENVGLGYIKLGQSAPTLSGGEAERVKLAKELQKKATGKTLFVLDEPTTGLHTDDIKRLLAILNKIVDNKDTVVVIEHNLDVIKVADYIIDLGPEGGDLGGEVVATGTPEEVAEVKESYTGQFLKKIL